MNFNKYQNLATTTAFRSFENKKQALSVWALGLSGESGEVADIIKKYVGHGHDLPKDKLMKELGDVLWYLAVMAEELGFSLESVATANLEKLKTRYPDGFSTACSLNHADE